jgi:hypothetical protein
MLTRDPNDSTPLLNFCVRLTPAMKAAIHRRARARSEQEGIAINPGQVVREILTEALSAELRPKQSQEEQVLDELLITSFFSRRVFVHLLRGHEGLATDLWKQSHEDLAKRKRGRK